MNNISEKLERLRIQLWEIYDFAPSVVLCRIPEVHFASTIVWSDGDAVLDHCCGDGAFAALAWPGRTIPFGCDLSEGAIASAARRGNYGEARVADAAKRLPYADSTMDIVFNNSALEHISDLDGALREVARVVKPGGRFYFNVLNHRYFDWWPLSDATREAYREWQPFLHALTLGQWAKKLEASGLHLSEVSGYFDRATARQFARLDYAFSRQALRGEESLVTWLYRRLPFYRSLLRRTIPSGKILVSEKKSAGFFITCERLTKC